MTNNQMIVQLEKAIAQLKSMPNETVIDVVAVEMDDHPIFMHGVDFELDFDYNVLDPVNTQDAQTSLYIKLAPTSN